MSDLSSPATAVTWLVLAAMIALCAVLAGAEAFVLDPIRAVLPALALLVIAGAMALGYAREQPRLYAGATAFLQMSLFTVAGVVLAYVLAAQGGALWDSQFAEADRALGFDWPAILAALDRWPALIFVLGLAYHSLVLQMIVAIVALSSTSQFGTLRTLAAAAVLSGFATILISGVAPAMGNLFDPDRYQHLWPSVAWLERDLVAGLRDGSHRVLDLTILTGIVSFPSYHATLSALFIWSLRDLPRLGGIMRVWAGVTILATPVFGGHYGVDVIAGVLLAVPAILVAKRLERTAPRRFAGAPRQRNCATAGA